MHFTLEQLICPVKALSPSTPVWAFPLQSTQPQEFKKKLQIIHAISSNGAANMKPNLWIVK
jgi:hypothetical protein